MDERKRGWRSRGYLPHFDLPGLIQAVTFRLSDALPDYVLQRWEDELSGIVPDERQRDLRRRINRYEDAGHGCCVLRYDEAAEIVQNALLHFDGDRYRLYGWVVMPNHVHALFEPLGNLPLGEIIGSWKSYSARQINARFEACSPLWYREYFDRFMRDSQHFTDALAYIEANPVKARLVERKEDFRWSSAFKQHP